MLLSTVPSQDGDLLAPRHVDLRPFAINDGDAGQGAARRADPGGAAGGQPGGQLLPGRRVEGHLGAHLPPPAPATARGRTARWTLPRAARSGGAPRPRHRGTEQRAAAAAVSRDRPMLSRAAEALFWIGRYVERAEDTARLLDVHFHQIARRPGRGRGRGLPVVRRP